MPNITSSTQFHQTLNPLIWKNEEMDLAVRVALLKSAYAFCEFLEVPGLKIEGVQFVGSNASFNYTPYSDCDVHVIIDFADSACHEMADNFFQTKKTLWNNIHDKVTVKGYKVELYAEDISNPVQASGVYDLLNGKWIKKPEAVEPTFDAPAVEAKADALANEIDAVCTAGDIDGINSMFERLRLMRRAGLQEAGEFSTENLAFKVVRNLGYIDKLSQARLEAQDSELTLETECPICETPEGGFHRCTVQTVNAFADFYHLQPVTRESDIPITGGDVVRQLQQRGLKMQVERGAQGRSLSQWVPAHRTGTWYISTQGHAMALINGQLVDAEHKGPDARRIIYAIEFKR